MVIGRSASTVSDQAGVSRESDFAPASYPSVLNLPDRVSVGIAHKSLLLGESLRELLLKEEDFRVVGLCSDSENAVRCANRLRNGVLLLDARIAAESPALLESLRHSTADVRIVLIMAAVDDDQILEALELGVRGIILESMGARLLVTCIRKVHAGEEWIEQVSAARLLRRFARRDQPRLTDTLSRREIEVIRGIARGLTNREIADELSINAATVKSHVHNVFRKLELDSRVAVTNWARSHRVT